MFRLSAKTLAGPGYIILNALRVINIICLLAVVIASMVMLVKTIIASKFFFFDGLSHIITFGVSILLIASELSLFKGYFARNWPLLCPDHGFVALGASMLVLGVNTLGNLNKSATSPQNLGLPFWRIVIGSGVLVMIFGFVNIVVSYVFRDKSLGVTARQVRAKGAVAMAQERHFQQSQWNAGLSKSHSMSSSGATAVRSAADAFRNDKEAYPTATPAMTNLPQTPPEAQHKEKQRSSIRFPQFNRRSALPPYHLSSPTPSSRYSERAGVGGADGARQMEISAPLGVNPQFAHWDMGEQRATAFHGWQ